MWTVIAALSLQPALAADASKPHPHQGVLAKMPGAPEVPTLTAEDLATLKEGKSVLKQERGKDGGRGIAIQDVHADAKTIWSRILKFDRYPDWVDNVKTCENYEEGGGTIKTHFVIGAALFSAEYWIRHEYKPSQNYMTWELDYTRESDLDDSVGFWYIEELPDKPGWSRLYYSVDVKVGGWVPGFVEDMVAKSGLTKATSWVKRESEKVAGTASE
ncbi:MAG: SRPBCC family protein [Alphaproteobacteria bacterium]|nr:SRPBCC family protein [Alphaproteobacteria bacterium]